MLSGARGTLLLGSSQPLAASTQAALAARLGARVRAYLGPCVAHDVADTLKGPRRVRHPRRVHARHLNEDLHPGDEFRLR